MNHLSLLFAALLATSLQSHDTSQITAQRRPPDQAQGLEGTVYLVSGNQMPSPDRRPATRRGVRATVCIYELTNISQATRPGLMAYYSAIATRQIAQVEADSTGHFSIALPPGHYSLFVKRGAGYYANGSDTHNNIAPVIVTPGIMTKVECRTEGDRPATY
ncbi:MAG: hypothetical protein P4L51_26295 [Puia sp.]|nr:hypothetical protein [Puia sp.]